MPRAADVARLGGAQRTGYELDASESRHLEGPSCETSVAVTTRALIAEACHRAAGIVSSNIPLLEARASELVAAETLEGHPVDRFLSEVNGSGAESLWLDSPADASPGIRPGTRLVRLERLGDAVVGGAGRPILGMEALHVT